MDLYQYFAKELDCFESDLRYRSYISWPAASVRHCKVAADDAQAWSEFLTYVFGVPLDFSTVDAAPLVDHLARDKDHFYQNDEIMEETLWLEQLRKMTQEP